MDRRFVKSSVVASIGYDSTAAVLEVEFRTRRVYRYFSVPLTVYHELMRAESIGNYFNRRIRDQYSFLEVTSDGSGS